MPLPVRTGLPLHRSSLLDVLRRIESHLSLSPSPALDAREMVMRRDLHDLVTAVDPEDAVSLAEVRLPVLRRILLAEWGEAALGDYASLVMLRSVDRLVAMDPRMRDLLRRAVVALKHST
ncbi:hypothetical protein EC912_101812 [Luteibacter rhizovicinus]|uniref:Uncharacterized protein n=1 Tax=Luteibacter rhizovicinus TaxID=242606 RepID=A0A4R3YX93_9GAMM|nr:hypothetical protein [Luteibacter rhizovicinus]TCV97795.1 hypothetical protein EC912_101812 [Luteibacter rhizovicinus]